MSEQEAGGCPVVDFTHTAATGPALQAFRLLDGSQDQARPAVRSEEAEGYWIFTDHEVILDGLQKPDLFSSRVIVPTDKNPMVKWIPVMLDGEEHRRWRTPMSQWFTPKRVALMQAEQREFAGRLIDAFLAKGECDLVADLAQLFPTTIFLRIMGMPLEDLDQFMAWERQILHTTHDSDPTFEIRMAGMLAVAGYFTELIAKRRADPASQGDDIVSTALGWEIGGERPTDEDLISCFLLLFMAGLDTVASQMSYAFLHLATHPQDRARLVAEPESVPDAVEELLRAFPIVQTARYVTEDTEFHGCPLRKSDMVLFPLALAGRDPRAFPDGREVDLDREDKRHLSFGAGPHRCLGSHLARLELAVVLQEWHRRIPDYELVGAPQEHTGGVYGLDALQLRWETA
jgi:cytochrome P450